MKFLLALLLTACTAHPQAPEKAVETNSVRILDMSFEPKVIKIKKGTTVKWTSESFSFHNVVTNDWYSPYLNTGNTWEKKFDKVGRIEYWCVPHRSMGMTGSIIVEE